MFSDSIREDAKLNESDKFHVIKVSVKVYII